MIKFSSFSLVLAVAAVASAEVTVSDVSFRQNWPWSNKVTIDFTLSGTDGAKQDASVTVRRGGVALDVDPLSFSGDRYNLSDGAHRIVWEPSKAGLSGASAELDFALSVGAAGAHRYLVLDISAGEGSDAVYPSYFLEDVPAGGWSELYKTTRLVMRRCEPGVFYPGSPDTELGHKSSETIQDTPVTFTNFFYLGVFETTVAQYKLLTGTNTLNTSGEAADANYPLRPVRGVKYCDLRGPGYWPSSTAVTDDSLMGQLRAKTRLPAGIPSGWVFDLPTSAQWEYACRAGSTTAYYNDLDILATKVDGQDANLNTLAWWRNNFDWKMYDVGLRVANAWGLYDMLGNVEEYILGVSEGGDGPSKPVSGIEPLGVRGYRNSSLAVYARGGSCMDDISKCRSAAWVEIWNRNSYDTFWNTSNRLCVGFRLCLHYVK